MNNIVLFALTRHESCLYNVTRKVCIKQYVSEVKFPSGSIVFFTSKEAPDKQKVSKFVKDIGQEGFMIQPLVGNKWLAIPNSFAGFNEKKIYVCRGSRPRISFLDDGNYLCLISRNSGCLCSFLRTARTRCIIMYNACILDENDSSRYIDSMAINPNGKVIAFGFEGHALIQKAEIYKRRGTFYGAVTKTATLPRGSVQRLVWSPDGETLGISYCKDASVTLVSSDFGLLKNMEGHDEPVEDFDFSPDGSMLASGSQDTKLMLWNIESGEIVQIYQGHASAISCLKYSPEGTYIVSGSRDNTLRLWSPEKDTCIRTFKGHTAKVTCVDFHPTGQFFVSGSDDSTVKVWSIAQETCIKTFKHIEGVIDVEFSPDGKAIVSSSKDQTVRLWTQ